METKNFLFYVNGKRHSIPADTINPDTTLLTYLRDELNLTGTKLVCAEGGCGACTVLLSSVSGPAVVHRAVNSCLTPLASVDGMLVTTVEGLNAKADGVHPIQERLVEHHGSQCGFCTPGMVMRMYSILANDPKPSIQDIEEGFDGNLCRCTGYRPILDAFKTFSPGHAEWAESSTPNDGKSCYYTDSSVFGPPQFPDELKSLGKTELVIEHADSIWYRPNNLQSMLKFTDQYKNAKIIVGNTEIGIEKRFKGAEYLYAVHPINVPELNILEETKEGLKIGAAVVLEDVGAFLERVIAKKSTKKRDICNGVTATCNTIVSQLKYFAGHQIRAAACIGGNIATASPISDLNPIWIATKTEIHVTSKKEGKRMVTADKFFLGYRKVDLHPGEVITHVVIPWPSASEYVAAYKVARRREDDIAAVNACFRVQLDDDGKVVEAGVAYGGVAAVSLCASKTADALKGLLWWSEDTLKSALTSISTEISIPDGAPGGIAAYRRIMVESLMFKFWMTVCGAGGQIIGEIPQSLLNRDVSFGRQRYADERVDNGAVSAPIQHLAATMQATGVAKYNDDIPVPSALRAHYVVSSCAHARIKSIDATDALKLDGVKAWIDHTDIPAGKTIGVTRHEEPVFAIDEVTAVGQPIGLIIATSADLARNAARLVRVEYEELPAILSINEAIEQDSYFDTYDMVYGDVDNEFKGADKVFEGELYMGGQSHFYFETHSVIVRPDDDGTIHVESSTQAPTHTQVDIAHVLGVPASKVTSKIRRMGGAFGGKESRASLPACGVAVAVRKLGIPIRMTMDREQDMQYMGGRHPFYFKYRVAFSNDGMCLALDANLYANAGNSLDLSSAIISRALFHIDGSYKWKALRGIGYLCKTHMPSNTAFRGFGAPQGVFLAETVMDVIARETGLKPEAVRRKNMYRNGDVTHYYQKIFGYSLPSMWDRVMKETDYEARHAAIENFNSSHRFVKRGISILPVKFGMAFTVKFLNQAGALVHAYTDGTVRVSHGGTEMGQGLNTKMAQITAESLGIAIEHVTITDTSTETVPNTTPTSASSGADLNGAAILNACDTINDRLAPLRSKFPDATFADLCQKAFLDRISLSAVGYYATPDVGYDFGKEDMRSRGRPFNYFSQGVAVSEVEVDVVTGEHQVLRSDCLVDVGRSLNPVLDIGQIEGAFVQGMGLYTLEECVWGNEAEPWIKPGALFTQGPGTYKLPGFGSIPIEFNVTLLEDCPNPRAVYSSKGVGEPPLLLAASVFFAIKQAIQATRTDTGYVRLDSPATMAVIRYAVCEFGDELQVGM